MIPNLSSGGIGENGPWLSASGTELFFTELFGAAGADHDIHLAEKTQSSWAVVAIPPMTLNTSGLEEDPFYDERTHTLWMSAGPVDETMNQIYEVPRTDTVTFGPRVVHDELGMRAGDSMEPALTADANTIFFSNNGRTVSRATRSSNQDPFDAPPIELTCADEIESPSPTGDGATLYVTDHSLAVNGRIARATVDGTMLSAPELVGDFQTNANAYYFDPFISPDESFLVFAQQDGNGTNIYLTTRCD